MDKKFEEVAFCVDVLSYFNLTTGRNFNDINPTYIKSIKARKKEGYSMEDFKKVIDVKTEEWIDDPKMKKYLNPTTLFRPSNFDKSTETASKGSNLGAYKI